MKFVIFYIYFSILLTIRFSKVLFYLVLLINTNIYKLYKKNKCYYLLFYKKKFKILSSSLEKFQNKKDNKIFLKKFLKEYYIYYI